MDSRLFYGKMIAVRTPESVASEKQDLPDEDVIKQTLLTSDSGSENLFSSIL